MSAGAMWDDDTGGAFGHPALQNRATKTSEYRRADPLDDTVKNSGDGATVHAYPLTDTLPEHLSDVEVKPAAPTTCAPVEGRTLTWSVPAGFAAGAETTIEVSAKPAQAVKCRNALRGG